MNTPILTIDECHNIESGSWFSKLSTKLQSAILSRSVVRRLVDGAPLATRGSAAEEWCGVARGAVRVSSVSLSGKQVTLTYVGLVPRSTVGTSFLGRREACGLLLSFNGPTRFPCMSLPVV